jgi:probable HAF family extracellular repeat protein
MQALPSLGLGVQDGASAINNNGAVVGHSCLGSPCNGDYHAFLWTLSGGIQDLGTLPGGVGTFAIGINSANHVVGGVQLPNNRSAAFIWTPATGMQELSPGSGLQGYGAMAINDSDEVIGSFGDPTDNQSHGFLWTQANGLKDLGVLPGGSSQAIGINNSGDVVGVARDAKGSGYSVIWRQGGTIQKLGPLAGVGLKSVATGINTSGEIAANGSALYRLKPTWVKLSPIGVNFGSWPVGQTSTVKIVALTNLGSTPLAISITLGGGNAGDFSEKIPCGSSLAAGAKCLIKITFTPTATGARGATINVSDSDWTSPQQVFLAGTGS